MDKLPHKNSPNPTTGNAAIADQLEKFDYNKFTEETWNEYLNLTIGKLTGRGKIESQKNPRVGGLEHNALYDYEGYRCIPVFEFTNPDDEKSPRYVAGVKLVKDTPEIPQTRINAGRAKLMNQQIESFTVHTPGIYYFLKKVAPVAQNASEAQKDKDVKPAKK